MMTPEELENFELNKIYVIRKRLVALAKLYRRKTHLSNKVPGYSPKWAHWRVEFEHELDTIRKLVNDLY